MVVIWTILIKNNRGVIMSNEIKGMMKIVCEEIKNLQSQEKDQGYLDKKDKELYESCMAAMKELYKR